MLTSSLISALDSAYDTGTTQAQKLVWINEVESLVYRNVVREFRYAEIDLVATTEEYAWPTGILFEDIERVVVNGVTYAKASIVANYEYTFFKSNGKIGLNPIPATSVADGLTLTYRYVPAAKTAALTETLSIIDDFGLQHANIYDYYVLTKAYTTIDEVGKANNYARLYQSALGALALWYNKNAPNVVAYERSRSWNRN